MNRTGFWLDLKNVALNVNNEYVFIKTPDDFHRLVKERLGDDAAEYFAAVCDEAGIKLVNV